MMPRAGFARFLKPLAGSLCLFFLAAASSQLAHAQVRFNQSGDHIAVEIDNQPFTDFYIGAAYPKPFLWPLRTSTNLVVTRNFPMKEVAGESHDHPHHRGLFIGYGEINGINFWENETGYKSTNRGRIVIRKIIDIKGGKKSGRLRTLFEWQDTGGAPIIEENRTMTFYSEPGRRTIDFDFTLTAKVALHWADTKEGFFAIRLADSMNEQHGGKMVNSVGATGEKNVWGKQANWVDYSGQVDGQAVGITILPNPENPKFPPHWHSRAYGLFAENPFGLADFIGQKDNKDGGFNMSPGQTARFRYRVVIHGGDITPLNVPDIYLQYLNSTK
jgi:hypothetical protein